MTAAISQNGPRSICVVRIISLLAGVIACFVVGKVFLDELRA